MSETTRKQIENKGYKVNVTVETVGQKLMFIAVATDRLGGKVHAMAVNESQALQRLNTLVTYS